MDDAAMDATSGAGGAAEARGRTESLEAVAREEHPTARPRVGTAPPAGAPNLDGIQETAPPPPPQGGPNFGSAADGDDVINIPSVSSDGSVLLLPTATLAAQTIDVGAILAGLGYLQEDIRRLRIQTNCVIEIYGINKDYAEAHMKKSNFGPVLVGMNVFGEKLQIVLSNPSDAKDCRESFKQLHRSEAVQPSWRVLPISLPETVIVRSCLIAIKQACIAPDLWTRLFVTDYGGTLWMDDANTSTSLSLAAAQVKSAQLLVWLHPDILGSFTPSQLATLLQSEIRASNIPAIHLQATPQPPKAHRRFLNNHLFYAYGDRMMQPSAAMPTASPTAPAAAAAAAPPGSSTAPAGTSQTLPGTLPYPTQPLLGAGTGMTAPLGAGTSTAAPLGAGVCLSASAGSVSPTMPYTPVFAGPHIAMQNLTAGSNMLGANFKGFVPSAEGKGKGKGKSKNKDGKGPNGPKKGGKGKGKKNM